MSPDPGPAMKTLLLSLMISLLLAPCGAAQEPGSHTRSVVTYTVQGSLASGADRTALPLPVIQRLSRERALAALDVNGGTSSAPYARAVFVFESADAFDRWITSPAGREVLDLLRRELRDPAAVVAVRNWPLASMVREST